MSTQRKLPEKLDVFCGRVSPMNKQTYDAKQAEILLKNKFTLRDCEGMETWNSHGQTFRKITIQHGQVNQLISLSRFAPYTIKLYSADQALHRLSQGEVLQVEGTVQRHRVQEGESQMWRADGIDWHKASLPADLSRFHPPLPTFPREPATEAEICQELARRYRLGIKVPGHVVYARVLAMVVGKHAEIGLGQHEPGGMSAIISGLEELREQTRHYHSKGIWTSCLEILSGDWAGRQ